ncbi:MAG: undecaprenyl-diphosphate phosphatase [Vicinamibacterales bacterium]
MDYLVAAFLGVIQGLTEFLPVSSTAHLLVLERMVGYEDPGGAFTVMIQLGSILAVMWLYRSKIVTVVRGLPSDADARRFAAAILVAFVPVVIVGLLAGDYIQTVVYGNLALIAAALVAGGVLMLVIERWRPEPEIVDAEQTPIGRALGIGLCQTLAAVLPGISRSGATIMGGMLMKLDRAAAAEFSFFLAMPTMVAAFANDLLEVRQQLAPDRALEIAIGFVMAFLASLLVVRPFLGFVRRAGFAPFAWYRIAAGLAVLAYAVAA